MRGLVTGFLVLVASLLLTGMGGFGGTPAGTVPQTEEDIRAVVFDRSGVSTELTRFSLDGNVFIEGGRGSGKVSVFFRELKSLRFGEAGTNEVDAELLLKSGESLQLKVRKRAVFYGATPYGAYHIAAYDVDRIEFAQ